MALTEEKVKQLEILKQKVFWAKDFAEPWKYFLSNFAENHEFMDAGETKDGHSLLINVIAIAASQLFGTNKVIIDKLVIIEITGHKFYHGICLINDMMTAFIYAEDINTGLLTILTSLLEGRQSIIRFSKTEPDDEHEDEITIVKNYLKH